MSRWDYIIIGAGSAGCVLANRLALASGATASRVLILEAGGRDWHPYIHIPAGCMKTFRHPGLNWCFETEPSAHTAGRSIFFPRGKVIGGSSTINGHLYVRGQARDFDIWAQLGNRGWSYDEVLPYFKRSERRIGGSKDDAWRGYEGSLPVADTDEHHPLCEAFIQAAIANGIPLNPDYNGVRQEGVSYYQRIIQNGRRISAARAFLKPALRRVSGLQLIDKAMVQRIVFQERRAVGVCYRRSGREHTVYAEREIILVAGAIGSPHILQLSGVGPAGLLRELGVPLVHDLAGVGEALQDHYAVRLVHQLNVPLSLNAQAHGLRLWGQVLRYLVQRRGLLGMQPAHAGGFVRSRPGLEEPDVQLLFAPASYSEGAVGQLHDFPGMTCGLLQLRPDSRGYVRARSPDPAVAPIIQPNYLAVPEDARTLLDGLRLARRILALPPLAHYSAGEIRPGPDCQDVAAVLDYARTTGATVYHAVGSCRMGQNRLAVVDPQLRVGVWHRWTSDSGCLDHADHGLGQYPCRDPDDR